MDKAFARLTEDRERLASRRVQVESELHGAQQKLDRLVDALADGSVPADEIKSRLTAEKARKTALTAELEKLQHVTQVASVDADQLKRTLRERVGDVIGLLERQPPQAR